MWKSQMKSQINVSCELIYSVDSLINVFLIKNNNYYHNSIRPTEDISRFMVTTWLWLCGALRKRVAFDRSSQARESEREREGHARMRTAARARRDRHAHVIKSVSLGFGFSVQRSVLSESVVVSVMCGYEFCNSWS